MQEADARHDLSEEQDVKRRGCACKSCWGCVDDGGGNGSGGIGVDQCGFALEEGSTSDSFGGSADIRATDGLECEACVSVGNCDIAIAPGRFHRMDS
eukprot:CAMPEP_0169296348 /NCGR_PEP_ID=MMETSP1016-20121227/65100_1 /TAXON_ID=342587 /ORGANISM="Karlodinium micrum, Strain CCMP2283" /LENGTH=96 /DNA_ID=CAMNT_0009387749 /DNA_START=256 /DNA_END=543 /DNA_ORIENTATION=+